MNNQLTRNAGWAAYLSGITALLSFAAYIAFLVFDLPQTMQSGNISQQTLTGDLIGLFQALSALFMIPIALALHHAAKTRAANASRVATIVGIVGITVLIAFSALILLRVMTEPQSGLPTALAFGAMGVWLVTTNYLTRGHELPSRLAWLGIVIGAAYVLFALVFWISGAANVESSAALQNNSPFLFGYAALSLSSFILYPIWAIGLGRVLLQMNSQANSAMRISTS